LEQASHGEGVLPFDPSQRMLQLIHGIVAVEGNLIEDHRLEVLRLTADRKGERRHVDPAVAVGRPLPDVGARVEILQFRLDPKYSSCYAGRRQRNMLYVR